MAGEASVGRAESAMKLSIKENVPLAPLTTFEIGGPAKYFADARSYVDINTAIAWAREHKTRFLILAGGSNVLIPDEGLDALVIRLVGDLYNFSEGIIDAWAGTNLLTLIRAVGTQGYGGWEKLAGIPGTIGGAVRGNAGAFGPEVKDFVKNVHAFNVETAEERSFANVECEFSYRNSFFKQHPEWVIVRVVLELQKIEPSESERAAEATVREREKRHIQNVRAAGSYFMNPVAPPAVREMFEREKGVVSRGGRVPAGWLIEKAGMKGARIGEAVASEQHPNYLKNDGSAKAVEVLALAKRIKDAVHAQFGVELTEEAMLL